MRAARAAGRRRRTVPTTAGAAEVHVCHALPRVADAAVDLDRGLAHRAGAAGGVRLGDRGGSAGVGRREGVDGPGGVEQRAQGTLGERPGLGQQVLHGLERADRHAVLAALPA